MSIFLKFDFSKAYDEVDRAFMFQVMRKRGMPSAFIKLIRMLFYDATIFVDINNQVTKSFEVHGGNPQGCPLAPY